RLRARACERRLRREEIEQAPGARLVAAQRYLLRLGRALEKVGAGSDLLGGGAEGVVGVEHLIDHLLLEPLRAPGGRLGGGGCRPHVVELRPPRKDRERKGQRGAVAVPERTEGPAQRVIEGGLTHIAAHAERRK